MSRERTISALNAYMAANTPHITVTDARPAEAGMTVITFQTDLPGNVATLFRDRMPDLLNPFNAISHNTIRKIGIEHQTTGHCYVVRTILDEKKLGL